MLAFCETVVECETGGILVGSYSADGSVVRVEETLGPPADSELMPTGFVRGFAGLTETLQRKWSSGKHYLGEWHFHPKGRTNPSTQDRRQMVEIACDSAYRCEYPILVINGGSESDGMLGVWVFVSGDLSRLQTVVPNRT